MLADLEDCIRHLYNSCQANAKLFLYSHEACYVSLYMLRPLLRPEC